MYDVHRLMVQNLHRFSYTVYM